MTTIHSGVVAWFTGLPASGKTTLAERVRDRLREAQIAVCVLDSDRVREIWMPERAYGDDDRARFYAALAGLSAHLCEQGLVVLVAATAHRRAYRDDARARAPRFIEIYVAASRESCAERDPKGLYAAARRGELESLPGVGVDYEPPARPDVVASGGCDDDAVSAIVSEIRTCLRDRDAPEVPARTPRTARKGEQPCAPTSKT